MLRLRGNGFLIFFRRQIQTAALAAGEQRKNKRADEQIFQHNFSLR